MSGVSRPARLRVRSALSGMDRDAYVMSYLGMLEIKPGNSVLETSVGTGLNFKYLRREFRRGLRSVLPIR